MRRSSDDTKDNPLFTAVGNAERSDSALRYLDTSGGFELGAGPSVVVLDAGAAKALTSTTMKNDIYAVSFDQQGLMGGVGVQGSKISRIHP